VVSEAPAQRLPQTSPDRRQPGVRELAAWRAFLRAHDAVTRVLETELERDQDLPLASYDVLVQLSEAPTRSLRMSELAGAVLISRSGLTRLVDRLEREGLVERRSCPSDARGTLAALTAAGQARLSAAAPGHLRGVREHFTAVFDDDEIETLARLLGRIAGPDHPPPGGGCGA